MQTKEYRTVDKSEWEDGQWKSEPDKVQWKDEATGLPCLIVRGPAGALCGYVGVAEGHRYFGKDYGAPIGPCTEECDIDIDIDYHCGHRIDSGVDVHGGLTFAGPCADTGDESRHICHVPDPGEPDHVWWFGFDCAHSGDVSPAYLHKYGRYGGYDSYKSLAYVRNEVTKLAAQLV